MASKVLVPILAVLIVVGAVGGFFGGQAAAPSGVEKTVTQTVGAGGTVTETKTVSGPETTETVTGPETTVTKTVAGSEVTVTKTMTATVTVGPIYEKGEWNSVKKWMDGYSASMTTETFYVPSDTWRVVWAYNGPTDMGVFGFTVYPKGETVMYTEMLLDSGRENAGITYIYEGPGEFYIKVSAANLDAWGMTITAWVPE